MTTRHAIRSRIRTLILADDPARYVQLGRVLAIEVDDLPAISFYFESGTSQPVNLRGDRQFVAQLRIDVTMANTGNDNSADTEADKIAELVLTDSTLRGLLVGISQTGFEYARDPEAPYMTLSYEYQVTYNDKVLGKPD